MILPVPRRGRWPAFLALAATAALWCAVVYPQIGRDRSAEFTFAATLVAFLFLLWLRRRGADLYDDKSLEPLKSGTRIFGTMLIMSIPFALLSVLLQPGADPASQWTVGAVLEMKDRLAEWRALARLEEVSKWLLLGAGALGLGLILLGRPGTLASLALRREWASKMLSLATLTVISFGSFSIIVGSSAAGTVRVADDKLAETLRRTAESLGRLEQEARIVVGEQLAAAMLDNAGATAAASEAETLFADLDRANRHLDGLTDGTLSPYEPPPSGDAPPSPQLGRIVVAYQRAFGPPAAPPPVRLADYAAVRIPDITRAVEAIPVRQRPSAQHWDRASLREAVALVVDLAMDGAGIRIPSIDVPGPLSGFFRKVAETVTSKPANDALKRAVTHVTARMLSGAPGADAGVRGIARPVAPKLQALREHLGGELSSARAQIRSLTTPSPPPPTADPQPSSGQGMCIYELFRNGVPTGITREAPCGSPP